MKHFKEKCCLAIMLCGFLASPATLGYLYKVMHARKVYNYGALPDVAFPLKYDLVLNASELPRTSSFTGNLHITIKLREPSNHLWLHAKDINITNVAIFEIKSFGHAVPLKLSIDVICISNDFIRLDLFDWHREEYQLKASKIHVVNILYKGYVRNDDIGLIKLKSKRSNKNKSQGWMIVNKPKSLRTVMPCLDETKYNTRWTLRVIHDPDIVAISNMPGKVYHNVAGALNKVASSFPSTPYLPIHLFGLFLLKKYFRTTVNQNDPSEVLQTFYSADTFDADEMSLIAEATQTGVDKLEDFLNCSMNWEKVDHIVVFDLLPSNTETYGIILHRESVFKEMLPVVDLEERMQIYYSLVKIGFETMVRQTALDRQRMMYSLTSVVTTRLLQEFPEVMEIKDFTQFQYCKKISFFDDKKSVFALSKASTAFKLFVTNGHCFMSMLEYLVGTEHFDRALQFYVQRNLLNTKNKVVSFARALQETRKPEGELSEVWLSDVDQIIDSYFTVGEFPELKLIVDYNNSMIHFVQNKNLSTVKRYSFIPVKLSSVKSNINEIVVIPDGKVATISREMDPSDCLYVDMDDRYMFYIHYDLQTLRCLAETLKTDISAIGPRNRAAIVREFFVTNFEGDVERYQAYLELMRYLFREKHFYVWSVVYMAWSVPGTKFTFGNKFANAGYSHFYHYLLTSLNVNSLPTDSEYEDEQIHGELYLKKFVEFKYGTVEKILLENKQKAADAISQAKNKAQDPQTPNMDVIFLEHFCYVMHNSSYEELKPLFQLIKQFLDQQKVLKLANCTGNTNIMRDVDSYYLQLPINNCSNHHYITFAAICPTRSEQFYVDMLDFINPKQVDFDVI